MIDPAVASCKLQKTLKKPTEKNFRVGDVFPDTGGDQAAVHICLKSRGMRAVKKQGLLSVASFPPFLPFISIKAK
jgi:hypothetical protein